MSIGKAYTTQQEQWAERVTVHGEDQNLDDVAVILSRSTSYRLKSCKGRGMYGEVLHAIEMTTNTPVAIKMFKSEDTCVRDARREWYILHTISQLDPDRYNLVQFYECLKYQQKPCLAFELLDRSLMDLLNDVSYLSLDQIRPIAQQLLEAFSGLKSLGIMHSDLKPDNVMLVNHQDQPFKVKLIDFGLAMPVSAIKPGMLFQALSFRAPEVTLGLPVSEAIDIWSLGCVLAFLYFGSLIFSGKTEYDVSPEEYTADTGIQVEQNPNSLNNLNTFRCASPPEDMVEVKDAKAFFSLLQQMFTVDPQTRITPEEALRHPFITMEHLWSFEGSSSYTEKSFYAMKVCAPLEDVYNNPDSDLYHGDLTVRDLDNAVLTVQQDTASSIVDVVGEGSTGETMIYFSGVSSVDAFVNRAMSDNTPSASTSDSIQEEQRTDRVTVPEDEQDSKSDSRVTKNKSKTKAT
ncbi:hypothetical protein LDENG_00085660 [Lucifuga dentata]|nr:hypothetical protein LDENG_00085660 [Lucifuga dentata]